MTTKIKTGLLSINEALGTAMCTSANPCGAVAQYHAGKDRPWQIADDHYIETFATLEDAIAAAGKWSAPE